MEISTWYQNPEMQPEEIEKRRQAVQVWVEGALSVAQTTGDSEAQELIDGVLSDIAIAKPAPEQHLIPIQGPEQPSIVLIPLFAEDVDINKTTMLLMEPNSTRVAHYTENRPGRIYMKAEDSMNPLLRGLLLLHEANHAKIYETTQFREGTELDTWHEEVATFEFEFRLLAKFYGQPYQDLLGKLVPQFIKEYDDKDGRGGTFPQPGTVDGDFLNMVFGISESEEEQRLRRGIVWLNVIFRVFEQVYKQTASGDKAQFLKQLYTQAAPKTPSSL